MFETTENITLQGGIFTEPTTLNLLRHPMNIVLGANGSGKTTISRHFINHKSDMYQDKVHIFNDDYIQANLSVKDQNGIRSIAMLGESQIKEDQRKTELEGLLSKVTARLEQIPNELEALNNRGIELKEKIFNALNDRKGGYAVRRYRSYGLTRWSARFGVVEADMNGLLSQLREVSTQSYNHAEVQHRIDSYIALLTPMGENPGNPITFQLPMDNLKEVIDQANALLQRVIPCPDLNERDDFMIRLATSATDGHYIFEAQERFVSNHERRCPLCCQPLTEEYIQTLKSRISAILNREAQAFRDDIDECISRLTAPVRNWDNLVRLPEDVVKNMNSAEQELYQALEYVKRLLEQKKNSLYTAMLPAGRDVTDILEEYHQAGSKLLQAIERYNTNIQNVTKIRAEFEALNLALTYLDNQKQLDAYWAAESQYNQLQIEQTQSEQAKKRYQDELRQLDDSKPDMTLAMQFINDCLSLVFFDDMHLMLKEEDEGEYVIKVRGEDVQPNNLSLGEKNVLALAYFFATLFAGLHKEEQYKQEMLVVIDDPISSFDEHNRMGMLTMLGNQLEQILLGNSKSKVLVMTHDIRTAEDLVQVRRRLNNQINRSRGILLDDRPKEKYLVLSNARLREVESREYNEYGDLLREVYDFAVSANEDEVSGQLTSIGNAMRRVLETYTTFNYKSGVEELTKCRYFQNGLSDKTVQFFTKFPMALMLNRESHGMNAYFDNIYTYEGKKRMAQATLYFLYKMNRVHLEEYLSREEGKVVSEFFREWDE